MLKILLIIVAALLVLGAAALWFLVHIMAQV